MGALFGDLPSYRLLRPYRFPGELVELVEAVTTTGPNNESTWIEWKSRLDLADKSGEVHVAKHVLGFANRMLTTARAHTGGYAYLIIGAEPGEVHGITSIDPAVLVPRINRYVGRQVRWRPEYVTVGGKEVLVVVVDPPEHGDPLFPVRTQLDKHDKGRILVRRPGATDVADDAEIDQLVDRVRAAKGGLDISLRPISSTIEQRPDFDLINDLTRAEKTAVLGRPRADVPARHDPASVLGVAAAAQMAAMSIMQQPDRRTDEDYTEEVGHYIEAYQHALLERAWLWLWRHRPVWLHLEVVNETDGNFRALEIELYIPGDVQAWPDGVTFDDSDEEVALPTRPPILGTPKNVNFNINPYIPAPNWTRAMANLRPNVTVGPTVRVRKTGSVTVDYGGINLRPQQTKALPLVRLLVAEEAGAVLECDWVATANNVERQVRGRVFLTVASSTFELDGLDQRD